MCFCFKWGGVALNKSHLRAFDKHNIDLSLARLKSDDIISTLSPLLGLCHKDINILTDNPSFEYSRLGITSKNIFQTFGRFEPDFFLEEAFLRQSNSKNLKYFSNANIIILSKDSMWFDRDKIKNPNDESLLKALDTIAKMEQFGFEKIESKYFYIYISDSC